MRYFISLNSVISISVINIFLKMSVQCPQADRLKCDCPVMFSRRVLMNGQMGKWFKLIVHNYQMNCNNVKVQ